jgi:CheY-like chemotaxis protein
MPAAPTHATCSKNPNGGFGRPGSLRRMLNRPPHRVNRFGGVIWGRPCTPVGPRPGVTRLVLQQLGYSVLVAANGEEAAAVAAGSTAVHLLLTDVVMPGTSGRAVAGRLCRHFSELRVPFMSGYTDDAVVRHGVEQDRVDFLPKSFTPAALTHKIRAVLDRCA